MIIRSRTRWNNEGEKNTKYLFELVKRHFNSKTIRNLKIDDNTTLNIDEEILSEAKRFYQTLYTSNSSFFPNISGEDLFFQQENHCTISDDERKLCEGLLTATECLASLKSMDQTRYLERTEFRINLIKSFGMTLSPFFSTLLTLHMRKAFSPYRRGEDY